MKIIQILKFVIVISFFCSSVLEAQIWLEDEAIYQEAQEFLDGEEYQEALPLLNLLEKKHASLDGIRSQVLALGTSVSLTAWMVAVIVYSSAELIGGTHNPFLYFRF